MLKVVPHTCVNGEPGGQRPVILNKARVSGRCEMGGGISERLSILIGLTVQKRCESGKGVEGRKTVIRGCVFMYPVKVGTKTDKVPTPRGGGDIDQLVVVFPSFIISIVRAPELEETR